MWGRGLPSVTPTAPVSPPETDDDPSAPWSQGGDGPDWLSGDCPSNDGPCELCQSTTTTRLEYGLRVCGACNREYLP